MRSLRETQRAFCDAVLSGQLDGIADLVRDRGIPAVQRMQIYRNNNRIGFHTTLKATYPVVERLAGADWFQQDAQRYQLRFPSRCGDLQFVGQHYPGFLRDELAGTQFEYFSDVAALEWAYQEVLTAADNTPLDPAELANVAPDDYERLVFTPRPALRLVASPYPLLAIWKANQPGAETCTAAESEIRLDAGESRVLLIRRRDHVELRELSPTSFSLLQQFSQGAALGMATEAVNANHDDFDLASTLQQFLSLETIAAFHFGRNDQPLTSLSGDHNEHDNDHQTS